MMAGVAAAVAVEMAANPGAVPATIFEKAKGWSPASPAGIQVLDHYTRTAGWCQGRLPGMRDMVGEFHPVFDRMMVVARHHEDAVTAEREAALRSPTGSADLWQAAIYRWSYWFGADGDLSRVYRDADDRLAVDPAYTGQTYDADHSPDELLRQVLDVTLVDWIRLLETLRATWPSMFDAVWRRDAVTVDRLSRQNRRMPDMPFLRARKNPADKLRAVVAVFWEAERLFELMHAIGGPRRVTMTKLLTALSSTSMLGEAVATDSLTGRYVGSMWCHRGALALLFDDGLAMDHDPRYPHRSFGPGGDAGTTDEIEGCVSEAALDLAGFNTRTAAPFALDSRLHDVQGEEPVHFFAGRDVRSLAIRFLLEVRTWLGSSKGRKPNQPPALFEIGTDSAIGRLALLMIARICPATARSVLREAIDAMALVRKTTSFVRNNPDVSPELDVPTTPGDVVANPRSWRMLYGETAPYGSIAAHAAWLGEDFLAGMVNKARHDNSQFVTNDPTKLGHTICFVPQVWFEPYRETGMLRAAWENVGPDHEAAFPECFDRTVLADELAFCLKVAARAQVSATDMIRDAHAREPDCVRSPKRGRAGIEPVMPPAAPLTATQRLLLARLKVAGMGGPVNQPIH
jgi:hypothetical protein